MSEWHEFQRKLLEMFGYNIPSKEINYQELDESTKDQGGAKKININMPPLHTIEDTIKYHKKIKNKDFQK